VLRDEGWRSFGLKAASTLGYRQMLLLATLTDAPRAASLSPLQCGVLDAEELDTYLAFRPDTSRDELLARWRDGAACCVARAGDTLIAAAWSRPGRADVAWIGYTCPLASDETYLHDAYTRAEWRGRGVAPALCAWQLAHLARAGFRRALRATVIENTAALRAHAKSGFRPIAEITQVRLGPWRRTVRREIVE
jgi:GNAT superfamily N-acetyltransferase